MTGPGEPLAPADLARSLAVVALGGWVATAVAVAAGAPWALGLYGLGVAAVVVERAVTARAARAARDARRCRAGHEDCDGSPVACLVRACDTLDGPGPDRAVPGRA